MICDECGSRDWYLRGGDDSFGYAWLLVCAQGHVQTAMPDQLLAIQIFDSHT